jgi:hypothetical protein
MTLVAWHLGLSDARREAEGDPTLIVHIPFNRYALAMKLGFPGIYGFETAFDQLAEAYKQGRADFATAIVR